MSSPEGTEEKVSSMGSNGSLDAFSGQVNTAEKENNSVLPSTIGRDRPMPLTWPLNFDFTVSFEGPDDPLHPENWPLKRKIYPGAVANYTCLCSSFASAVLSPASLAIGQHFGVSTEVATLATSLFVLGYVLGPMIWAPLSELRGRKLPIVIGMLGFTLFSAGAATAANLQTLLICRFFAGAMGSSPLTVAAG